MTPKYATNKEELCTLETELQEEINTATEVEEQAEIDLEQGQIYQVTEELEKLHTSLARAQADYANLLKRVERDKTDMTSFITANIIKRFLPTVDNLERALATIPPQVAEQKWTEGIRATLQGLLKQLETMGVKAFESIGQEVDTEHHEVMSQIPGKAGIIITEFEKGYMLHDRVIRHAKVIVGSGE